jgi:phosphomevalonate kinase
MKLRASAPGKVVLLGEYAVLQGAPALVMAADRRAIVEIESVPLAGIELHAPDVHSAPVHFELNADGTPRWTRGGEAAPALELVTGLLRGLVSIGAIEPAHMACRLRLDTSAFFWRKGSAVEKLGLGSSAALTVALASALVRHRGRAELLDDRASWLRQLLALHRAFQQGRGSGLDVAASLYGGVIRYQLRSNDEPCAEALRWPADLVPLMVWSGQSASTSRYLADLEDWRRREPQRAAGLFMELSATATAAVSAVQAAASLQVLELAEKYADLLQTLGEAAKILIFTKEHQAIRAIVRAVDEAEGAASNDPAASTDAGERNLSGAHPRLKASYKPCGAGGGDLGMALAADRATADALRRRLTAGGFEIVDLKEDPAGLRLEQFE